MLWSSRRVWEKTSPQVRAAACELFAFLGLEIDARKNEGKPIDEDIATHELQVRVLVIQAQEDWAIAGECWKFAIRQGDS